MTFEEYVLARGPALVRLARLLVRDAHRADDLVQEVLARAYPRWARICRTDQPDRYLRRMLVNASRSWWRRRANHEVVVADVGDQPGWKDIGTEAADREALWRLVSVLPDRQRAVLALRYYEDLDDASIAAILGCSQATVRTHAMRALAAVRAQLGTAGWPTGPTRSENGRQR
ncbi:SigE family RNA polymerase sigma factor [Micromonospora sp. NPDC049559]|uniref:SigE family RNA polymerase sigma factor n=1 Tax=Micromonospora sp. NPDC049559 TaxID=3155923 RepID=UPI0034323230